MSLVRETLAQTLPSWSTLRASDVISSSLLLLNHLHSSSSARKIVVWSSASKRHQLWPIAASVRKQEKEDS